MCNQYISPLKLWVRTPVHGEVYLIQHYVIVCQWLATCRWFSPNSSTNKTECHNITEILLKVALNTINQTKPSSVCGFWILIWYFKLFLKPIIYNIPSVTLTNLRVREMKYQHFFMRSLRFLYMVRKWNLIQAFCDGWGSFLEWAGCSEWYYM